MPSLSRCCCVLLSATLSVIPASSAALGTDSCALQQTTGSDGRQRFAGGGEGVGEPDCAAAYAASVGLSTDERVSCRCAERLAERLGAQGSQIFSCEVLRVTAAPPGGGLDWAC